MITAVGIPITGLFSDCRETPVNFIATVRHENSYVYYLSAKERQKINVELIPGQPTRLATKT